jgi:hypothetical protein
VSLADAWGDPSPPSSAKRVRLDPTIAAALAARDVAAAVPDWPRARSRSRSPPLASSLLPADALARDRVRAVLATADVTGTTVAAVRRRVAVEGGGSARVPGRVVRAVVDEVMGGEGGKGGARVLQGGKGGARVLQGGGGTGGRGGGAGPPLPAGLDADDVPAYLLASEHAATPILTAADELTLPYAPDPRDAVVAASLRVVEAMAAASPAVPRASAIDGARVAHIAAVGGLRAAWVASHKKGRGTMATWAGLFRPPPGPGQDGGEREAVESGGDAVHPVPRRRVVAVPSKGGGGGGHTYAPRATRAFAAAAAGGLPPPAPQDDEEALLASCLDGLPPDAATVLDRAARAGVRPGVVLAAAARLKREGGG